MTLAFIVVWIFVFLLSIITIMLLSTIRFKITNVKIKNKEYKEEKIDLNDLWKYIDLDFNISVSIYFLNIIKIFEYRFNTQKAKKLKLDEKVKRLHYDDVKREVELDFDKSMIKPLKHLRLKELNLNIDIGTSNSILTSYIVAVIATILSIFLARIIKNNVNKHKYRVNPIYTNKNILNIKLNCIFFTKMVHIIYIIVIFLRKRRVKIYERTSNRRTNVNSDGQYTRYGRREYNNRGTNTNI